VALSIILNYEEGGENCLAHGDGQSEHLLTEIVGASPILGARSANIESLYDYGSRVGFWRLRRLLTKYLGAGKVTVFAVGMALERNVVAACAMLQAGWEVASHGYRWWDYQDVSKATEMGHIARTVQVHRDIFGDGGGPVGCYQGKPSQNTRSILTEGFYRSPFLYDSDSYADDLPYWHYGDGGAGDGTYRPHLVIPYTLSENDMRFVTPNGFSDGDEFFAFLRDSLAYLIDECRSTGRSKMMNVGLHCRLARPGRAAGLEKFLKYVTRMEAYGSVWVCRRDEICRHWYENHYPTVEDVPGGEARTVAPAPDVSELGRPDEVALARTARILMVRGVVLDDNDISVPPSSENTKKRSSISAAAAPSTPSKKKARTVPAAAANSSPPAPVAAAGASPAGGGATLTVRLKEVEDQVGLDGSGAILGRVVSLEECVFGGGYAPPSRMLLARVAALETNLLGEVQATAADAHMFTLTDVGSSAMFTPMDVGSSTMKKKEYEDATEQISVQISNKQEKNVFDKSKHAAKLHKTSPKNSDQTTVPSFRSLATSRWSKDEDRTRCLLVHRIPKRCTEEHLSKIFAAHTGDVPAEIPQIEFGNGNTGKVMVRFESKEQAASVFEGIEGKFEEDAKGSPQKRVYLKNGGYISVKVLQYRVL